jgi:hypothetical protein
LIAAAPLEIAHLFWKLLPTQEATKENILSA